MPISSTYTLGKRNENVGIKNLRHQGIHVIFSCSKRHRASYSSNNLSRTNVVSGDKIFLHIMTGFRRSFKELVTECVGVTSMSGLPDSINTFFAIYQFLSFLEYFSSIISYACLTQEYISLSGISSLRFTLSQNFIALFTGVVTAEYRSVIPCNLFIGGTERHRGKVIHINHAEHVVQDIEYKCGIEARSKLPERSLLRHPVHRRAIVAKLLYIHCQMK